MKAGRLPTRDVREDRSEREEKLGTALETLPGKTIRDRNRNTRSGDVRPAHPDRTFGKRPAKPPKDHSLRSETLAVITRATRSVWFHFHAAEARNVSLAGTFNHWNPGATPLSECKKGEWRAQIDLAPGQYEYRFVVDGVWQDDPVASRTVPNPFGGRNSILTVI